MFYHSWAEAIHRSCIVGPLAITDQGASDLSSRKPDLITNADGSVDVFIGPTEPEGKKIWIKTALGEGWFAYFRFYAPTEGYFDKTWSLPDIEKVKSITGRPTRTWTACWLNIRTSRTPST
jgi:hypothetical protein